MLNRGEAPAAQLFAISEDAEIRYTTTGMLYEVPGIERSTSAMSAGAGADKQGPNKMSLDLLNRYTSCALLAL